MHKTELPGSQPDRDGKIFCTSYTSLSHRSKMLINEKS